VHVFEPEGLSGEPKETDEMAPRYFPESEIPYQDMWADDIYWLPIFLRGRRFEGVFEFEEDEKTIIRYELKEVEE
jgi:8-oxo-dGTP diphosphatase / 2-hydroxy-dATP diphosphatase